MVEIRGTVRIFFIIKTNNNSQFHATIKFIGTYYMQIDVGSLVIRWRNKNRNEPSSLEGIIY